MFPVRTICNPLTPALSPNGERECAVLVGSLYQLMAQIDWDLHLAAEG